MSLSTLTQCHPKVCSIARGHPFESLGSEPPPLDWRRISQATVIAAVATTLSQVVAAPVDVGGRAVRAAMPGSGVGIYSALVQAVNHRGLRGAFDGLPLHLLKRVPTKTLTVAFFEMGTQIMTRVSSVSTLNALQHVSVATCSGTLALLLTYPVHTTYYALRKKVPFEQILSRALLKPKVLYTGVVPAVLGTAPAVIVDYAVYRALRARIDKNKLQRFEPAWRTTSLMITAAAAANLMGGFMSEPFKAVSRKMAIEAVRTEERGSIHRTARAMLQGGIGEFWRGFHVRSARYAVSAMVSKATVQHLKSRNGFDQYRYITDDSPVLLANRKKNPATLLISPRVASTRNRSQTLVSRS